MSEIWSPSDKIETIVISDRAAKNIAAGNLWIFSNEIRSKPPTLKKGTWCHFQTDGRTVGFGYFNDHSLIAGRVVSTLAPLNIPTLLRQKIEASFQRRLSESVLDSARLIFSEADFLPGLVLDCFSGVLVLQSNTAGIDAILSLLDEIVPAAYENVFGKKAKAFVVRGNASVRALEGVPDFSRVVFGKESELIAGSFVQDGVSYAANFMEGQKTGFFLDQRDNRHFLSSWLEGRPHSTVLDLFSYSGGWGLTALKGGAKNVTFVDESAPALSLVKNGVKLNSFGESMARMVESDVFDFLETEPAEFDVIVADPPAFVKSKKNLPQALRAYEKLNRWAWRKLKSGGLLLTCSCSYHLGEGDFLQLLSAAVAKEGGLAHVVFRGGQAADHPILLSMPETRYLKCIGLKKL